MLRNTSASKQFIKVQINEEFYYAVKQIFINEEKGVLIASLNNGEAYRRLVSNYESFCIHQRSIGQEYFSIADDEANLKVSLKGDLQVILNFLRMCDLFSETTYQIAVDELNTHKDADNYNITDEPEEMNVSKRFRR